MNQGLAPPALFKTFAILCGIGVMAYILASIIFAPADNPNFHFDEDGAITALSTVILAMSGIVALLVFYLRTGDWNFSALFWLVLAAGCVFLALDEQLELHERGGRVLDASSVGEAEFLRNWNDFIVILYGVVALSVAGFFGREIIRCRAFVALFATGFMFYVLHTGIDSIMPSTVTWKFIPEESAKLMSVFFVFLAVCAQILAMIDGLLGEASPSATRSTRI